ncbi:MAG: DUF1294 domain-containing protein [Paludibacteraceae bacterium]|nr:DUF1294 domain-containing protein [Paludibacteraceae bacterium]MBR6111427.1 DUF1294 domain-containing protein [Paludibacteraceae bacterium]
MTMNILYIYLAIINVVAFAAYGWDKWKAQKSKWRTPESTLILFAAIGGALGAYAGMKCFRHKTQHKKFTILVPLFLIAWIAGLGWGMTRL